jgi:hypothetical protein
LFTVQTYSERRQSLPELLLPLLAAAVVSISVLAVDMSSLNDTARSEVSVVIESRRCMNLVCSRVAV